MAFLQKSWWFDISGTFDISEYNFTRVPVAVIGTFFHLLSFYLLLSSLLTLPHCLGELTVNDKVQRIYFYAIHTKSKMVQGGEALWKSSVPANQIKFIQKAVNNRRRITGELYEMNRLFLSLLTLVRGCVNALRK